jgi:hypothetical protein
MTGADVNVLSIVIVGNNVSLMSVVEVNLHQASMIHYYLQ